MNVVFFRNDREAVFVKRPNRFLIIARDGDEELFCHCPNPGRLMEVLFPGARLILEKRGASEADAGGSSVPKPGGKKPEAAKPAKTLWTAAAVYHRDRIMPLFSSRANRAAEELLLKAIIPNLGAVHPEYAIGSSRFDFLCLDASGVRHLVEVKACSLVEEGVAMFPDAPSQRALKHLEELAALTAKGYSCHVLFVILHGECRRFVPNLHTDPAFASALSRLGAAAPHAAGKVAVHAALLSCEDGGKARLVKPSVPVDLGHGELALGNGGNYLIILKLGEGREIEVGALGIIAFEEGWYVYAGSARKNLSQRVRRHLRKTHKQKHWHFDFLTPYAETLSALPIMSYRNLECSLAEDLKKTGARGVPGFGCSDCRCGRNGGSHLYYFKKPPLFNRDFVDMVLRYRHVEGLRK
jgi:sugar fermentation stimulation protein A